MQLTGRSVLVTGGAGGIGGAIAKRLAQAGARIAVADLNAEQARAMAGELGGEAFAITADVTDEASVQAMMDATLARFGRLDVLVHAAGIGVAREFLDMSFADWRRVLSINLDGAFLCCHAAARLMAAQQSGAIIAIASTAAERPSARASAYNASKSGVVGLVRTIAIELAHRNVRANAISPGPIDTDLALRMHTDATRNAFAMRIPMARYGKPEEIAGAALYLASDEASYVTGEVLHVDGGYSSSGITRLAGSN